jgi:hypothetical protein
VQEDKPAFDQHQFDGKRARAVSAETRIAHSDYQRMGNDYRGKGLRCKLRSEIPAWSQDNKKIATVVKMKMWRYIHYQSWSMPPAITVEELNNAVLERSKKTTKMSEDENLSAYQRNVAASHARFVDGPGGYAGLLTKVIWLAYRMNMDSVNVAKETGLSPVHVRALLQRLNNIARFLFPEDTPPRDESKAKKGRATKGKVVRAKLYRFDGPKVHEMRQAGKNWRIIANALNAKHCNKIKVHYAEWMRNRGADESGEVKQCK